MRIRLSKGSKYVLHDAWNQEAIYLCVDRYPEDDYSSHNAVMRNVLSGWTFTAHGTNIYPDGSIDWDFSTNGRFEKK